MDKANGFRPSLKMYEEADCSKEQLDEIKKMMSLHENTFRDMFRQHVIYGTCGCRFNEDGTTTSLTIEEIDNLKTKL